MKYLSDFDTKTLHDGSNRRSKTPLPVNTRAQAVAIEMANGQLFDPNYGQGVNAIPQPFNALFFMRFATEGAAETEEAAIKAKLGVTGTATASFTSGAANQTCTATLEDAVFQWRRNGRAFLVTLSLKPFNDWS